MLLLRRIRFVLTLSLKTEDAQTFHPQIGTVERLAKNNRDATKNVERLDGKRQNAIRCLRRSCSLHLVAQRAGTVAVPRVGGKMRG